MITKLITQISLKALIANILPYFQIIAPVYRDHISFFKRISQYEEIDWQAANTTKPPKEFLFPCAGDLFQFQTQGKEVVIHELDNLHGQKIILGLRPCDAASLKILDRVFLHDGIDVPYLSLRESTLLIGQSCQKPGQECFCTALGLHPKDSQNMDIMLTQLGQERFLVQIISPRGEEFLSYFSGFFQEADSFSGYSSLLDQTEEMANFINRGHRFDLQKIRDWLTDQAEDQFWLSLSTKCIGCGACTFFCPTCYCFDITDESIGYKHGGFQGVKRRRWNSCSLAHPIQMSIPLPLSGRTSKFRPRILHKFASFVDRFQQVACVGCGRCRHVCPVGIDLIEVLNSIHSLCSHDNYVGPRAQSGQ